MQEACQTLSGVARAEDVALRVPELLRIRLRSPARDPSVLLRDGHADDGLTVADCGPGLWTPG